MIATLPFLGLAVLFWLGLAVVAILLGLLREAVFAPRLSHPAAQAVGGGLLCLAVLMAAWLLVRLGAPGVGAAWGAGALWLALTLGFEVAMLSGVRREPMTALLPLLDVRRGEALPAVLMTSFFGPPILCYLA